MDQQGWWGLFGIMLLAQATHASTDAETSSFMLYAETLALATAADFQQCEIGPSRKGEATWYRANGIGNCSFDRLSDDMLVAALNKAEYGRAEWCGTCAQVSGPKGSVKVQIADRCPECGPGDLDLSSAAFAAIAELDQGRVDVSWKFVPCDDEQEVSLRYKSGSDPHWAAVQVRGHRLPVSRVEYRDESGRFQPLKRQRYNFFVKPGGVGKQLATYRITDHFGQQLVVQDLRFLPGRDQATGQQFSACPN